MKKITILLFLTGLFAFGKASAQASDQDTTTLHFIIQASIGNMQEIGAGNLAVQKASRPDVKAYGQQMITDHTKAQATLMQLAKSKGYQVPAAATSKPVPDLMLAKATGKDFDRMYVHMMAPSHRQTVLMYQTYVVSGKDPDVKNYAAQTLPVVKGHLNTITAIDNQLKDMAQ